MNEFLGMGAVQRRTRRNQASDRLQIAWITALITTCLGGLFIVWIAFDTGEWIASLLYLIPTGFALWLAWMTREYQSQLAAGMLLLNAVLTPVIRWIQTGRLSSIIVGIVLIVIYLRAFQATMDLAELRGAEKAEQVSGGVP
jgi:hypothetical protein